MLMKRLGRKVRINQRLESSSLNKKPYIRKHLNFLKNHCCKIGGVHIQVQEMESAVAEMISATPPFHPFSAADWPSAFLYWQLSQ